MTATGDPEPTQLDMSTRTQVRPRAEVAHGAQGAQSVP
jgi:hypothetical protein